jgi:hypothetical protein
MEGTRGCGGEDQRMERTREREEKPRTRRRRRRRRRRKRRRRVYQGDNKIYRIKK